jgi:hypothetical protein
LVDVRRRLAQVPDRSYICGTMPWRISPERIVTEAGAELAAVFGPALRTVVVYGSAAGGDFRADRSDVNFAAIAEPLSFAHLQQTAQWYARWRGQRVAAPLLLAFADLDRSLDVFPLEILDIQARHRTLAGSELFAGIVPSADAVRVECEREAKGKLVRLRALYLELAGSTREIRELMLDSRKTFVHVMRGLLFLRGMAWEPNEAAVVAAFAARLERPFPVLTALTNGYEIGAIERRFEDYLAEIEVLTGLADTAGTPAR